MNAMEAATLGVRRGKSTPQIIAENPQFKPNTLSVFASRVRKKMGLLSPPVPGRPLQIPRDLHVAMEREAIARGYQSVNQLALTILSIVATDDMFDAVIDEVRP